MSGANGRFSLKELQDKAPAVSALEALRKSMANALSGSVSESDMIGIVGKLKEQALAGDKKAMELFFKLMLGDGKTQEPAKEPQGVQALANSIADLVDEIRISKEDAPKGRRRPVLTGPKEDDDED